ncbi:MAG: hypothetical protein HZA51_02045 [Planctomycetes bacterium]|nr:hypothetical protein [Planctomycetota bacterium]
MNTESLERLLIDRHLGELSDDAECLLDEFISNSPEAQAAAVAISATLRTAARAMSVHPNESAPLPPLASLPADLPPLVFRTSLARRFAVAAAIVLSFWLGGRLHAPLPRINSDAIPPITQISDASPENVWSLRHHSSRPGSNRNSVATHIQWTSPVAKPLLGERS